MESKKRIIFIVNPISGIHDKENIPRLVSNHLDRQRFDYEVIFTEYAGHAADIARQSASEGVDIAVAVGGDGTINEVARSLTHTKTALVSFLVVQATDWHAICVYLWTRLKLSN
jgi:diacylglycerol kinase family enzyme